MKVGDRILVRSAVPGLPDQEVIFIGMQESPIPGEEAYAFFDLTKDVAGLPAGSSISIEGLEDVGYIFPKDIYSGR